MEFKFDQKRLMATGLFKTPADLMVYFIARLLAESDGPIGSWRLKADLDEVGVKCGTATIGRHLKQLDSMGYTVQRGNRGRKLTPRGRSWLDNINNRLTRLRIRDNLTSSIQVNELADMIDLMKARKLIEVEAARLAALNATAEDLEEIQHTLGLHHQHVEENIDPMEPALAFHLAIAKASHNKFIHAVLSLLAYEEKMIESHIEVLCTRELGKAYVVTHEHIARAVRERKPNDAARLMEVHMSDILTDVEGQIREKGDALSL